MLVWVKKKGEVSCRHCWYR